MQVHFNIQLTAPCLLVSFQSLLLTSKKLLCQRYYRPMSLLLRSSCGLFQRSRCLQMVQSYLMQDWCSFSGHVLVLTLTDTMYISPCFHNHCLSQLSLLNFELPFFKDMSILRNTIQYMVRFKFTVVTQKHCVLLKNCILRPQCSSLHSLGTKQSIISIFSLAAQLNINIEALINTRTLMKRCALVARTEVKQTQELQDRWANA